MKKLLKLLLKVVLGAVLIAVAVVVINYFNSGIHVHKRNGQPNNTLSEPITILDWNLGYAGLGEESDFVMDGGENLLPPSRAVVDKNVAGIVKVLQDNPADIHFFQEISKPDMLDMGVDLLGHVRTQIDGDYSYFTYDFHSVFIPRPWSLKHGLATFSKAKPEKFSIRRLPNEPERLSGFLQRQYQIQITESEIARKKWAFMNIHLSAFDEGGNVRVKQFETLLETATEYYDQGYHVVIGGDWNMQLVETNFPNTTKHKDLFWLEKMPKDKLPQNWSLAYDTKVASMRTNYQPYIKGENYTTIIDGFLVSPNVEVLTVKTLDTDFKYTDHQAVLAQFRHRE